MKISDFLLPANVTADAAYSDRQRVLEALAQKAGPIVDVLADRILADLLKREQLGSTGVGGGVAIPHARYHQIEKPFGMLLRLRKPIDFDAVDGNPVDTVFLLLLPDTQNGDQLGALASIGRKLRDPVAMAALRRARDSAEIYRALTAE
jgi:PTS system nitrogen regulatory IIA component